MASDPISTIKPPEGINWEPQGPYGLQRFKEGEDGRLLRVGEALHWMGHKLEWPRKKALYAVFSHLVQLDEADLPHRRMVLYVINDDDYAQPLAIGDKLNPKTKSLWGELSYSYPDASSWGTVREIADTWEESWPGYVSHTDDFYRVGWIEYCKQMKGLARSSGAADWEEIYRTRYFMSLDGWVKRCAKFMHSFGRLAVPFAVANELWSWGTVVEEASASPFPLADWPALVAYRRANSGGDWGLGNQIAVARTELGRLVHEGASKSNALTAMANEVGLGSRQAMDKVLSAERKRANKAASASTVTKVQDGRKAA